MKDLKEPYDEFEKAGFFDLTEEKKETIKAICEEANLPLSYFIQLMQANTLVVSPEELIKKLAKPERKSLGKIDFTKLIDTCQQYIDFVDSDEYHEDNEYQYYIFEKAMEAVFGKSIWDFINNRQP